MDFILGHNAIVRRVDDFRFWSFLKGVHPFGVWRQADRGHGGPQSAGVGPAEHGLRAAAPRVQPEVPDALHPRLSEQAGTDPRPLCFFEFQNNMILHGNELVAAF